MDETLMRWLFDPMIGKFVVAAAGALIIMTIFRLLKRSLRGRIKDQHLRFRISKAVGFLSYVAIVFFLALVFKDALGGLTVAFGVAGAGIAFALQEVITSVAGWVAVSFGGYYRTGDRVQLGGIRGDVIDIGVLRTTIMETGDWVRGDLYNGRIVRIANSFVFKEPVYNYSGDFAFLWDEIVFRVRLDSDLTMARDVFTRVADEVVGEFTAQAAESWQGIVRKFDIENAQTDPLVTMTADDGGAEFTLRYVTHYRQRRKTKDRLFARVLEEFDKSEGRIVPASGSIEVVSPSTMNVSVSGKVA